MEREDKRKELFERAREGMLRIEEDVMLEVNTAGYRNGASGKALVDPFTAVPDVCTDRENEKDRLYGLYYERGYIGGRREFMIKNKLAATIDPAFRRIVEKIDLCDAARLIGIEACEDGRSAAAILDYRMTELVEGRDKEIVTAVYDSWDEGYAKSLEDMGRYGKLPGWLPTFDVGRAAHLEELGNSGKCPDEDDVCPEEVYKAYMSMREALEGMEENVAVNCLTCGYRFDMWNCAPECDEACEEPISLIENLFSAEDRIISKYLYHDRMESKNE